MYFVIFGTDKPGMQQARADARQRHRAYLRQPGRHPVKVWLGGPTHQPQTASMNGTLLVVEADTLSDVEAFVRDDPYSHAGLFQALEIRPWTCGLGNLCGGGHEH